jgi:hypothetical protein
MRSSAAASLCIHEKPIRALFRYSAGGGNHHRRPSSSSRRSPWRGGSSSPLGLRVCTSSYVFNVSLSLVFLMARSWCIGGFVNIVGSYGDFPSILLWWIEFSLWDFVLIGLNTFMDLRALDICLAYEYLWWQWGIILIHLICVLALNSRIPEVTLGVIYA